MSSQSVSKYQKFETVRVCRKNINNAPYNPRKIGEDELKRLKKAIKNKGLVQPIVWNERTGNIVGGHQRIKALDILEKTDEYFIDVARINVDEAEEVHINIMLNNDSIMGEYDVDILKDLKDEFDLDLGSIGFSDADIDIMFGGNISVFLEDTEDVEKAKEKIKEIKDHRKEYNEKNKEANSAEYYFMVVCNSEKEKIELMRKIGVQPYERFVMSEAIERFLTPIKGHD